MQESIKKDSMIRHQPSTFYSASAEGVPTDNLVLNTKDFNALKIVVKGTTSITQSPTEAIVETRVTHNLGFIPVPLVFYTSGGVYYQQLPVSSLVFDGADAGKGKTDLLLGCFVDATTLYITLWTPDFTGSQYYGLSNEFSITYYLLKESAD